MKWLLAVSLLTVCMMVVTARFVDRPEMIEDDDVKDNLESWDDLELYRRCPKCGEMLKYENYQRHKCKI